MLDRLCPEAFGQKNLNFKKHKKVLKNIEKVP